MAVAEQNPGATVFCQRCGSKIVQQEATCPRCGNQMAGIPLAAVMLPVKPKSRAAYVAIAFLFGFTGIHNVYAGRWLRAAAQGGVTLFFWYLVFPVVLVWMWAIFESCLLTKDGRGLLMRW